MAPTALNNDVPSDIDITLTSTLVHEAGEYACIYGPKYAALKRQIIKKGDEKAVIKAWTEVLEGIAKATDEFIEKGNKLIPEVDYSELHTLSAERIAEIKKRGCVLVRNVVDKELVLQWKKQLVEYIDTNRPNVVGVPRDNPQFMEIYYSKAQFRARSHPHVLNTDRWLNQLWHCKPTSPVSLSTPLINTSRLRMRQPGPEVWTRLGPHVDGGSIERWQDEGFRSCYEKILKGDWKNHDPWDFDGRMGANVNLFGHRERFWSTFQGWLALSNTGPGEGTIQVFPDLMLSISYLILRPFFRIVDPNSPTPLAASNWVLDLSNPDFTGIAHKKVAFGPIRLTKESHPHVRVDEALISIPKVQPGDMFFWHSDVIHAVEQRHTGKTDSSVLYMGATALTEENIKYIVDTREHFFRGKAPSFYIQGEGEGGFIGKGEVEDVAEGPARRFMGFEPLTEADVDNTAGAKEIMRFANELITAPA